MTNTLNRATIIGRLGKDPDIRTSQGGKEIASFSLATSEKWKDKQTGESKEKTEWHRVVCFNEGLTKIISQYCRKGMLLFVEGSLTTRKWSDNNGVERYTTEIVLANFNGTLKMLSGSGERSEGGSSSRSTPQERNASAPTRAAELDDDIPF